MRRLLSPGDIGRNGAALERRRPPARAATLKTAATTVDVRTEGTARMTREGVPEDWCYLLVLEGSTSRIVRLPPRGEVALGSDEACLVRLTDPSVAARHALIALTGDAAAISPAGPLSRVKVDGVDVVESAALASGDSVALGNVTLVFHRDAVELRSCAMLDRDELRRALAGEIERTRRYGRPVTVLLIDRADEAPERHRRAGGGAVFDRGRLAAAAAGQLRRLDSLGWDGDGQLLIVLPETPDGTVPAGRLLRVLARVAPGVRAGIATCPTDGTDVDALLSTVRRAARAAPAGGSATAREASATITVGTERFVVADPAMVKLFALVERLAASDAPVLLTGETGVGKEVAAAALHAWSPRRRHPLVCINCAAIPETLLESELFGHERGAFSGAAAAKPGRLESAAGGTVLLDEIGDLSAGAQAKLLRVLEIKRSNRLGALEERAVDVRIVAATNRSLVDEVAAGRFRQDLYFRLAAATVVVPPLRDRREDLPALARHLLAEACARLGRAVPVIAPGAMLALASHPWPGNVRELRNVLEVVAATVTVPVVGAEDLRGLLAAAPARAPAAVEAAATPATVPAFRNLYEEIRELERVRIAAALAASGGVRVRAAALIGMPLRTFVTKLREHGFTDGTGPRLRARA
jgi:two-component system, NtrC family, response regulator AtoC